jgi:hypothetical protein
MDLDQGGTFREWANVYMGPSIGYVRRPVLNTLPITAGGTYTVDLSTSYITVSTTGSVTVVLPSTLNPVAGVGAVPGPFVDNPVVVADIAGAAAAHPITIQPAAGDTIMGLASIQITTNYGAFTLAPNSSARTWNSIAP